MQGRLAEAEPLLREALAGYRCELGDTHPDTLASINNYASLLSDQGKLDEAAPLEMVDLFRASANVGPAVDAAIRLRARSVWMQLGVIDEAAAGKARDAGLTVVMDRCPVIENARLGLGLGLKLV